MHLVGLYTYRYIKLGKVNRTAAVTNEYLRHLQSRPLIHLTHIFNHCNRPLHLPIWWKEASVIKLSDQIPQNFIPINVYFKGQNIRERSERNTPKAHEGKVLFKCKPVWGSYMSQLYIPSKAYGSREALRRISGGKEPNMRCLFNIRRHSWIGHTIRHNKFVVNILEGAISRKKAVGRPRLQYLKQFARNTGADSYTAMKRMACNRSRWKAANQSKDWGIRRKKKI